MEDSYIGGKFGLNVVHPSFKHGKNFQIGHFCIVEEDVEVGDNVKLLNYVWLIKGTKLGNDVFLDSYCKTADGAIVGDSVKMRPYAQLATGTIVGDRAFLGPNATCLRGSVGDHDFGAPVIGKDVYIGADAKLLPKVKIGDGAIVGAGAVVTKDIDPGAVVVGMPAKPLKRK